MQLKSFTCLLIAAALAVATTAAHAQETDGHPSIQQLDAQLDAGTLDEPGYLRAVDAWINNQFGEGVLYPRDTLLKLLTNFQRLAWATDSLPGYRINYYINLANNATYGGRGGEAIYFLEKAEGQVAREYGEKPLMVAGEKCNGYLNNGNYRNVIATYEKERSYLEQFPELLRNESLNLNIGASFINVMNPTLHAYAKLQDTTGFRNAMALTEAIYEALENHPRWKPQSNTAFTVRFYMEELRYVNEFSINGNRGKSREALHKMEQALYGDTIQPPSLAKRLAPELNHRMADYFLTYHENDSAAVYIDILKNTPEVYHDDALSQHLFEAQLLANRGNYRSAYEHVITAANDMDSVRSVLVDDIDELLYAHTEAEINRQALQVAEQQKQRRTLWLIAVSVAAALAILITSLVIRRRNRKTKEQLDKLNQAASIQITALEEIKAQAVRDEQRRLARDLHDGLSATLASAKLQLEMLAMDSGPDIAEKATRIQCQIEQAYAIARGKSHQWYDDADSSEETDFENRIQQVLDSALADSRYTKEVHVDDGTLAGITLDVRIDLLRIVQEAITNTIKHAKARHVSVLLYREENELLLSVADNGNGMKAKNTAYTGVGIRSMRERSEQHGGRLSIESGQQGTQITASIPLAPPMAG